MEQPRYLLHEAVGVGGMGVVYRGTLVSPAGERPVAIKQLVERGRIDRKRRARLVAEARLVFRLTHANICQVLDLGEGERGTFVVMELVRGCDLRALLEQLAAEGRRLDAACALYVAREVARGLDYAHRFRDPEGAPLGLVHGDVTPQNVLLSVEGEVKLADFGIAHALDEAAPGAGLLAGTPGYVAPELDRGQRDHRLDIYGLGVTLLVSLTSRPPEAALAALGQLRALRPDVTAQLQDILSRATAARPEQRFASAAELERALSTELARRHPTFTPSVLAEIVRAHAPAGPGERQAQGVLRSMTIVDARTAGDDDEPAAEGAPPFVSTPPPAPAGTQTAHTQAGRAPSRLVLLGLTVAAAALTMAAIVVGVSRHATKTVAPATETVAPPATKNGASATKTVAPAATENGARATENVAADEVAAELPAPEPPAPAPAATATATGERRAHAAPGRATPSRRKPEPAAAGFITVNANPWGAVLVDGKQIAPETPLYRHPLPAGDHVIVVRFADGTRSAPSRLHLGPGELRTLGFSR